MFIFCSKYFGKLSLLNLFVIALLIFSGCANQEVSKVQDARVHADQIAETSDFKKSLVATQSFTFLTYQKFKSPEPALTIYIEGDGRSWVTRNRLSPDPTPRNPLALKLAVLDPSANVAYLARPCQYTPHHLSRACRPEIWSDQRFSEAVIGNMNQAIEILKTTAHAKIIHLVGFSGGGGVAALIAARRRDIASLKTVAGDLDHTALSQHHRTTPLYGSLNPKAAAYQLIRIPQLHFAGEKDHIVPPFISAAFTNEINRQGGRHAKQFVLKDATHHEGWEKVWPKLVAMPVD